MQNYSMAKALCKIMDSFLTYKIFLCLFYFFIFSREGSRNVYVDSTEDIPESEGVATGSANHTVEE